MSASQQTPHLRQNHGRRDFGWQERAACQGKDLFLFFGPEGERAPDRDIRERKAKRVCAVCPVRAECLADALQEAPQHGVWGGMSAEERTSQRRSILRRKQPAA